MRFVEEAGQLPAERERVRSKSKKPVDRPSTLEALGRKMLEEAISPQLRQRIMRESGFALLIEAPSASWCETIAAAAAELRRWSAEYVHDGSNKNHKPSYKSREAVEALSAGRSLLGVSPDPRILLPSALVQAADSWVVVRQPNSATIAAVIAAVTGRVGISLPEDVVVGLDHDDIVAAIRRGSTARGCRDRLAAARRSRILRYSNAEIPRIEELSGYGAAGGWAKDLIDGFAHFRAEKVTFAALQSRVVLASEPGLGKTTFAKALAKSLEVPLISTSVATLFSNEDGHLGDVIRSLDQTFREARSSAPSVLLLDELDALPNRATMDNRARDFWTPVVTRFLTALDALADAPVVVVGATNHAERLDSALVRAGRLEKVIRIGPPSPDDIAQILRQQLGRELLRADLAPLTCLALGRTGADIVSAVKLARTLARQQGRRLALEDLHRAFLPDDRRSAPLLRRIACHEAGHAVATVLLTSNILHFVSLVCDAGSAGRSMSTPGPDGIVRLDDVEAEIICNLAGRAAEEVLVGDISAGGISDLESATRLVVMLHAGAGLRGKLTHLFAANASTTLAEHPHLRRVVERDLRRLHKRAIAFVRANRWTVEAVADALLAQSVVTGDFVANLVRSAGPPFPPSR
ncbi:AAA family ATPase [Bosea massiliensis]|uniref:AAA family ATPase n=1 Tax=Bosea massiliensis TaxID=151419 RepID=A0ABW0P3X7_9HYPH